MACPVHSGGETYCTTCGCDVPNLTDEMRAVLRAAIEWGSRDSHGYLNGTITTQADVALITAVTAYLVAREGTC